MNLTIFPKDVALMTVTVVSICLISCRSNSSPKIKFAENSGNETLHSQHVDKRIELDAEKYIQWIKDPDHGLFCKKVVGNITYFLQYEPIAYVALRNLKKQEITHDQLKNEEDGLSGLQYFTFRISTDNGTDILKYGIENQGEFGLRVDYYSFRMQSDLKLVEGNDTLPCVLFHFERTFGITPYASFVLAFELPTAGNQEKDAKRKDKQFIYRDQTLKNGIIKVKIKGADLAKIPDLKTDIR